MRTLLRPLAILCPRATASCLAFILAFIATLGVGPQVWAATYTPTIFTDPAVTGGVNSATGVITGGAGAGQVSLRSAVIAANAAGGTNSITLGAGTYQLTIPGTGETAPSGDATIGDLDALAPASGTNTLTVQGAGAGSTTIQQTSGVDRVFDLHPVNVAGSITFNLNDVTVTGGVSTTSAGAILAGRLGDATALTNCVFNGNTAATNGGAISQSSGGASHNLTITNCVFSNNTATTGGGGAVNYSGLGSVSITGSTFSGNTAGNQGGALNVSGTGSGPVTTNILRNTFLNNTGNGTQYGGAALASTNAQAINFNFNRLVGNTSPNLNTSLSPNFGDGRVITASGGTITTFNTDNNWWGINSGPVTTAGSRSLFGTSATQWLQLRNSASPASVNLGSTSTASADIFGLNTGGATAASNLTGLPAFPSAGTVFGNAQKGTIPGGTIRFVNGAASVVFTGTAVGSGGVDATADTQTVTASITVTGQAPGITSANNTTFTVGTNGSFTVTTTGNPTGASMSITASGALPGAVTFVNNNNGTATLSGTPNAGTGGSYPITITANNGVAPNATQSFTLKVQGPPTVSNVAVNANEDIALAFTAGNFTGSYSDPNSDPLVTVRITSLPANGVLRISGSTFTVPQDIAIASIGTLTYTSNLNYSGPDSFGWNGSDGTLFATTGATVNVTVAPVNDNPVANPDTIVRYGVQPVKVRISVLLSNDTDPENNSRSLTAVSAPTPAGATVTQDGSWVYYTPTTGSTSAGSFTYTISDGQGGTANGLVTVNIIVDNSIAQNITKIETLGDGSKRLTFGGIPGRTYRVQSTDTLTPATWVDRATVAADAQGKLQFTDPPPLPGTRFYRTVSP